MRKRISQPQNMNYKILLFLIVLISIPSYSQKKYLFDYMMEYDFKYTDTSRVRKKIVLTNSKDNSYILTVSEKDSLNFQLDFLDINGIRTIVYLDKKSFIKAESISIKCDFVWVSDCISNFKPKKNRFINKSDTLVDSEYYPHYILKSNNPKREKRKKLGTRHFIIEKNTPFHLPILNLLTPMDYNEWKLEKNIPNGILKEMFLETYRTNKCLNFYKLKQFAKINKYLVVPEECDYTKPEVIKKRFSSFKVYFK